MKNKSNNKGFQGISITGDVYNCTFITKVRAQINIFINGNKKTLSNDPHTDNVRDIRCYELIVTQREIDLRIGMLVFMSFAVACLFAFWCPSLWGNLTIAGTLDIIALIIASGFVMKAVGIVRHKEYVGSLIQQNLVNCELKKLLGD